MKLTLRQLVDAAPALQRFGNDKFPAHLAFRIMGNIQVINPKLELYSNQLKKLQEKYGVLQKDGSYDVPPEIGQAFLEENEKLLAEEVDLDISLIALDEITIHVAPLDLMAILWMISSKA